MIYNHYKNFISMNYPNQSDAFKEGVRTAFDQVESNITRLSLNKLREMIIDRKERSILGLQAAKTENEKDFQLGYQAVCDHFLK